MKHLKKTLVLVVCVLMLAGLAACGAGETTGSARDATSFQYMADAKNEAAADTAVFDSATSTVEKPKAESQGEKSVYQNAAVKLIRRADLQIQTVDFDGSVTTLEQLVHQLNGYYENVVLNSGSYYNQGGYRSGQYVVRIPAESYDVFMAQVGGVGYLAHRSESTQDVGQEYFDTESRLATQRTKQERLQQLLKQAKNMEDIIVIESALSDVEYEIEQLTSTIKRYDGLIGYATIHVNIQEMQRITDDPGQQTNLFRRMKTGIISSIGDVVDGVQNVLVWVCYNLFGIIILAAVAVGGVFLGKKYVKVRKAKKGTQGEEKP